MTSIFYRQKIQSGPKKSADLMRRQLLRKVSLDFVFYFVRISAVFLKFRSFYFPGKQTGARRQGTLAFCCAVSLDKRRERNEKRTFTEDIIYGGTGTHGSHYLHHGIYPAGIFPDHGPFHYIFNRTGCSRCNYLRTKRRRCLRPGFWYHQLYAVLWYGRIRNHAVQH